MLTTEVGTMLDRECDHYRETRDKVATLSVVYAAKLTRDHYPTATHINCGYSDQPGCGLYMEAVVLADGTIIESAYDEFADTISGPLSNLNEDCEGGWRPFFIEDDDTGEELAEDMDALLLNIDQALSAELNEEQDEIVLMWGTPTDGFNLAGPFTPNDPEFERATDLHLNNSYWWYAPIVSAADFISGVFNGTTPRRISGA